MIGNKIRGIGEIMLRENDMEELMKYSIKIQSQILLNLKALSINKRYAHEKD